MRFAFMTSLAFYIKLRRQLAFIFMRVVAGQTSHLAVVETFTGRQHSILIAVNVYTCDRFGCILCKESKKAVTSLKSKGRPGWGQPSVVAKPTEVQALLAGSPGGIED